MITAVRSANVRIAQPDHPDWDAYVREHPNGCIFHTSAMVRVFRQSKGIEPFAVAAVGEDGNLIALLVSCHIRTLPELPSMSSRAVQFAEPLCNPDAEGIAALSKLIALHDNYMRSRALLSEIRVVCPNHGINEALKRNGYQHLDYVNYMVHLENDVEKLWQNVNKRMRQRIRSSHRKGVVVRDDNSPEGIERFYRLLLSSYARARVPLLGRDLFEHTARVLPRESVRLRTAFYAGHPVASVLTLAFGDRLYSWYGGTLRVKGISAFACIVWDDMVWGSENGFKWYDFGGAGWPHEDYGPRQFKAKFGGQEVRHGRYVLTYSKLRRRLAELAFQVSRRLGAWSHQPSEAALFGDRKKGSR